MSFIRHQTKGKRARELPSSSSTALLPTLIRSIIDPAVERERERERVERRMTFPYFVENNNNIVVAAHLVPSGNSVEDDDVFSNQKTEKN